MPVFPLPQTLPASDGATPATTGASSSSSASGATPATQYRIQLRDHSLNPIGELPDWIDADLLLKLNDVGAFVVTVRADSPLLSAFAAGNGVIISRDRGDGSGAQTLLSGPIWHLERRGRDNTYLLAGPSDEWWLKARRADPVTTYPYRAFVLADTPLRYLRCGDAAGSTTLADSSASATPATWQAGTYALGVSGGIDDSDTALQTTGGWFRGSGAGLPTGAAAYWMHCWFLTPGTPTGFQQLMAFGNGNNSQSPSLLVNASGQVYGNNNGVNSTLASYSVGVWHHACLVYTGTQLVFYLDGVAVGSPVTTTPNNVATYFAAGAHVDGANPFSGSLDEAAWGAGTLSAAHVLALYQTGISRYANAAYDIRTGAASTVMQGYVNANAGPGAVAARRVTGLALAADPAIGVSVTGNARFDNLLALLQQLAVSGGDIAFRLVQTNNGVLTFSVYQPATRSNAIFSRDLGNLLDFVYTLDGPQANQDVAAGGGQGVSRTFQANSNAGSVATWGLVEGFIDARDTTDLPTMQQRISADLAQNQQVTSLSITPQDTAALQFGRDYNLGDVVNVTIDGATITDKVRQIHIQLNGSAQELVTPGIGNAGAGEIAWLFDAKARALAAIQAQVRRLQAAQ